MSRFCTHLFRGVLILSLSGVLIRESAAAILNWDGITGGWDTVANWSTSTVAITPDPGAAPIAGDTAIFNVTTVNGTETVSLNANQAAASLTFKNTGTTTIDGNTVGSTAQTLTLSGGSITINAGTGVVTMGGNGLGITIGSSQTWTNNSSNLFTVSANITNGAATQLGIAGTGDTLISGVYGSSAGPLEKTGTGTLTLSGVNTYTGATSIGRSNLAGGTLRMSGSGTLGTGLVTVFDGTLDLNGTTQTFGGASLTLGGGASGSTAAITIGTGTLSLTTNLQYTATNNPNGALISGVGGGKLQLDGAANPTFTVNDSSGATNDLTISAIIQNGTRTGFIKSGAGTLVLSGANTYTGTTLINVGILSASSLNSVSGGSASSSLGAPVTVGNGTISLGSSNNTGTLSYAGTGETTDRVLNLAGTTGGGVVDQSGTGLLKFTSNLTAVGNGVKTLTLQGSTAGTGEIAGVIVNSNGGATATSVTKAGTGTWTLSGGSANTFTGAVQVSGGILALNKTAGVSAIGNVTTTIDSGATLHWDASNQVNNSATMLLNGGTMNFNGQSETMGTLSASANSFMDFGSGTSAIEFADSIGTLTANSISISNFTLGSDSLRFGAAAGTVDVTRLIFSDFGGVVGVNDGTGFITPNLTFSGNDIFLSNPITGTNSITQNTAGTTMFVTGANTSSGTATVNAGTLSIGTSAGGNWAGNVVANGGILKGRGTISGNLVINSGATYSPGNSPGIQVVAGNATVNPGGTLLIEIDGTTAGNGAGFYDQTQVGGTATINGGTLQGFTIFSGSTNFIPQFGTKVTFLTASSVTGSFNSYDFSANGNGVSWMPEYRNTEMNLFAVPADFGNVSGFNSNQNALGRALQSLRPAAIDARTVAGSSGVTATSDTGKIFNGLMRANVDGLRAAYDQLSPEKLTAMSATVKMFGSISNSGTSQRLNQIRWGDRGVSLNGITLQTLDGDYEYELMVLDHGTMMVPKKKFSGKIGFFVNTTGNYSDVDSDERRIGYENRLGGITAGVDREFTKEVTAGIYAGQGYADTKLGGGGGSVEANSGRIGIYGGYHKNGYYLNGSLGAGTTSFDTKRNIGFIGETASGSTQGYDLSGQIVGGIDFQTDEWVWGPIAKLDYGYQWIEKYNERGSAARLNLDSQSGASAETGAGMRVSRPFNYNGWKWIPELRLMGSHQWEKPNDIRAQFAAGGDAFTVHPEGAGQEMIIPGATLQLRLSETTTLNFGYEARVNLESCSHQLDLGIQTKF